MLLSWMLIENRSVLLALAVGCALRASSWTKFAGQCDDAPSVNDDKEITFAPKRVEPISDFESDWHRRYPPCRFPVAKTKKTRMILADLSGCPACAEPTSSVVRRSRAYNKPLS
jgi:hypothetical protein